MSWLSRLFPKRNQPATSPPMVPVTTALTIEDDGTEPRMVECKVVKPATVVRRGRSIELVPGRTTRLSPSTADALRTAGAVLVAPFELGEDDA